MEKTFKSRQATFDLKEYSINSMEKTFKLRQTIINLRLFYTNFRRIVQITRISFHYLLLNFNADLNKLNTIKMNLCNL